MARRAIKDDWGNVIKAGDVISFSYGIPPVGVKAPVVEKDGILWALTPGHAPEQAKLSYIRKWFNIYKEKIQ